MLGLLYKDFRANVKWLLISGGVVLLFNLLMGLTGISNHDIDFIGMTSIYYLLYATVFFMMGSFSLNYVQTDERKKWGYFVASLPGGIANQVVSKYIFVALTVFFTFAVCYTQNFIVQQINDEIGSIAGILLILSCIVLVMVSIELPCAIAFGTKIGSYVKAGIFLLIVFFAAVYLMFGDITWLGSEEEFTDKFLTKLSHLDLSTTAGKVILCGIPLYCISCMISTKLYLNGIERMEK